MDYVRDIQKTADYMKGRLSNDSSGHDWWHTFRVWKLGSKIAKEEGADLYVVELTCLLHDIADYKLNNGDEEIGPKLAGNWLRGLKVEKDVTEKIVNIISNSSFKGANAENKINNLNLEGQCVQDADRLDAIGAIGIARCFAFGGKKGNIMYDPSIPINMGMSEEEYKKADHTQINHFYEKLILLKDRMNTKTAKKLAEEKHEFMELFLDQFYKEWNLSVF